MRKKREKQCSRADVECTMMAMMIKVDDKMNKKKKKNTNYKQNRTEIEIKKEKNSTTNAQHNCIYEIQLYNILREN